MEPGDEEIQEAETATEEVKTVQHGPWIDPEGKRALEERFGPNHPLVEVARCESGYKQFKEDGTVLTNPDPNSSASGIFQILAITHGPTAKNLGMDILTPEGNMDFAEHLYSKNGLSDWKESEFCWGPKVYA